MTANLTDEAFARGLTDEAAATALIARVHRLNVSRGGVPKRPVAEARLTRKGLVGDRQAKPFIHGGPERAQDQRQKATFSVVVRQLFTWTS